MTGRFPSSSVGRMMLEENYMSQEKEGKGGFFYFHHSLFFFPLPSHKEKGSILIL